MKPEYILCAAIHFLDGIKHLHQPKNIESGFVVAGRRHHNCYVTISILHKLDLSKDSILKGMESVQGFITSNDRFLNRRESYDVAVASGQIEDDSEVKRLMSEDLY